MFLPALLLWHKPAVPQVDRHSKVVAVKIQIVLITLDVVPGRAGRDSCLADPFGAADRNTSADHLRELRL